MNTFHNTRSFLISRGEENLSEEKMVETVQIVLLVTSTTIWYYDLLFLVKFFHFFFKTPPTRPGGCWCNLVDTLQVTPMLCYWEKYCFLSYFKLAFGFVRLITRIIEDVWLKSAPLNFGEMFYKNNDSTIIFPYQWKEVQRLILAFDTNAGF